MEIRRDVFQAIADPTRRAIISLLAQTPQNVNSLAEQFEMSRQAVSLHVKILYECGMLSVEKEGRERRCSVQLEKLKEVSDWVEPLRQLWEQRFHQLDNVLRTLNTNTNEK